MNTTARHLLAALAIAVLSGCASHPELRPYTAEETRQLQLEALQRQGLSLEEYEQRKLAVSRAGRPQVVTDAARTRTAISG
ncbi:hypothetical protein N5E96_13365 [Pseudomonas mosselii]|uniref:hypothetical protein n=1 Tax=Pseudomonas mosselii TaxID=78327 RepID=UPI0007706A8A|nr:hypothetical protein [Pseudomonas mosselii]AMK30485.1 hypothetical protein AWT69_001848 [Pseudomonas putida]MBC3450434.1 hypothetical protein [Pseudomonas mosselii]MDH1655325.1 hypothetical protein [Pseudomonas mosselii]MDH1716946.1 hypothetical protein [Pseudomonas mosselii]MDH1722270.1 hypothetical protein [Pseudomonas mosselii]